MPRSPSHPLRGSVLLLCMAILAAMTVLAFAYVRSMQLSRATSTEVQRVLLAREAALTGRNHAIEQILRGFVQEPLTRLDGPAFAPFTAHDGPWNPKDTAATALLNRDDVSAETPLAGPLILPNGMAGYSNPALPFTTGWITWDGRGRWLQPSFLNRTPPFLDGTGAPDTTLAKPTATLRFGVPPGADPEIAGGIAYDERLRRIPGDATAAHAQARLRTRYAVGVIDLDGGILFNPDAALDYRAVTEADPGLLPASAIPARPDEQARPGYSAGSYKPDQLRALYGRVIRAGHAVPALAIAWARFGDIDNEQKLRNGSPMRAEQAFLGRGMSNNVDLDPARGGAPVSFPLMYRGGNPDLYTACEYANHNVAFRYWPVEDLFGGGAARKAGGVPMPTSSAITHLRTGPLFSFAGFDAACSAQVKEGVYDVGLTAMGSFTPFGRGLLRSDVGSTYRATPDASLDQAPDRWHGAVDTPWCVNILTAPAQVVVGMMTAYVPPSPFHVAFSYPTGISRTYPSQPLRILRDLFVPQMSPAFAAYLPPQQTVGGQVIAPDYHIQGFSSADNGGGRLGWRSPQDRYPGEMVENGIDAHGAMVFDDLGRWLRTTATGPDGAGRTVCARDPFTGTWLWQQPRDMTGSYAGIAYRRPGIPVPATGSSPAYEQFDSSDGLKMVYRCAPDSIWNAIGEAMAATAAVARGQWLQFGSAQADPSRLFNGGRWPAGAPRAASAIDLDRLFLANLGIDPDSPSSPVPATAWCGVDANVPVRLVGFHPLCNPASLRATPPAGFAVNDPAEPGYDAGRPSYTAAERTAVMELVINDARMSFFGGSPAYGSAFRPLDLDGDGKAHCSACPSEGTATARERTLHIDQYVSADPATGRPATDAPVANPFSLTGCFFIGKSRFYRIVVRGELWDDLRQVPVSQALLDTVLCVDPGDEAKELSGPAAQHPARQYATHVLAQRYWFDKYRGNMSRER